MAADPTTISRPKPADLIPGYLLEKLVGRGGMGEVYQAVQLSLGRTVAVKVLATDLAKDENFVARFDKEGAALAALQHPNIVSIVDKGRAKETYFLVMEFIAGPSLRELMRSPNFEEGQALRIMGQICRAIEYAHGRGVIHRDLKPENILFDEQSGGIAKVTDFGLAGLDDQIGEKLKLTGTNVAMGTASYMAPEQRSDARSADQRADIYSLGVLLYELICGDVPVGHFDAPSTKKPHLDRRFDAIVARCLKPQPSERYNTVAELMADLEPLVPALSSISNAKLSTVQRVMQRARNLAILTLRYSAIALTLFAGSIVAASYLRSSAHEKKVAAGIELITDFGARFPIPRAGRVDKEQKTVTLGEGPDQINVVAMGRKVISKDGDILYSAPTDARTGRTVIDATVDGEGITFSALVETQEVPKSKLEPLFEIFRGPRPDARSAIMLVGDVARFVALVISGTGDEPKLEWDLGPEHRGTMLTTMSLNDGPQFLQLNIDPVTGDLSAFVGKDRDRRRLGSPIQLGPKWKELFGDDVRPALGCLEGTCAFHRVELRGSSAPAVAPPPPMPPLAKAPEEKKEPIASTANATRKPPPPAIKMPLPVPPPVKKDTRQPAKRK